MVVSLLGFEVYCFSHFVSSMAINSNCPWDVLFPESYPSSSSDPPISVSRNIIQHKSFAQPLNNSCAVPLSQLPKPCVKGDEISIKIPENEYLAGLEGCKTHLHGRLLLC